VDTDRNPRTGQAHDGVGSEYNLRAVIRNHIFHGGGVIDPIERPGGGPTPMFVDGDRVIVRVPLAEIGNPKLFKWNCEVFASTGDHGYLTDPRVFDPSGYTSDDDDPARVVIAPNALLQSGVASVTPVIRIFNSHGMPLSAEGHKVALFAYRDLVSTMSGTVRAVAGRAGTTKLTVMVDGIVSCNAMHVAVGSIEIVPSVLHLQWPDETVGKVSARVLDATGAPVELRDGQLSFSIDNTSVTTFSSDGVVEALLTGAGKVACLRAEYDGTPAASPCHVRVLANPAPLLPAREVRGRHVSFWYPPVVMSPPPMGCRFEEMLRQYDVVPTLDKLYLRTQELTGAVPVFGPPLHVKALCEDEQFTVCGAAGHDAVVLGFNPHKPTANSCVQVSESTIGLPHWGIMSHEIGHVFLDQFRVLRRILGDQRLTSSLAYGEGLATLCGIWARRAIAASADHDGVSAATVKAFEAPELYDSLPFWRRIYVDERLAPYLVAGGRYPEDCTPDVLDGMLMVLGEKYGWDIFPRFFSVFYPPDEPIDFIARDERQRATFFIAAMSAAAAADLRAQFAEWGLPCDDGLFRKLLPELTWRAAQREASPAIRITAPTSGLQVSRGRPVRVSLAVAPEAQADLVRLQVDGKDRAVWGKAPAEFDWITEKEQPGCYFLRAVAELKDGTQQRSVPVVVELIPSETGG